MTYNPEKDGERRAIIIDAETKEMITKMHLLLTDENVGLCGRMVKSESAIRRLQNWRNFLTGACTTVGMVLGALWERKP